MIERTLSRALGALLLIALLPACAFAESTLQQSATKLFQSLNEAQRYRAVLPFNARERNSEVFPGGKRAGIPLKELTQEQQKLAMDVLGRFTSRYGREKAEAISKQ